MAFELNLNPPAPPAPAVSTQPSFLQKIGSFFGYNPTPTPPPMQSGSFNLNLSTPTAPIPKSNQPMDFPVSTPDQKANLQTAIQKAQSFNSAEDNNSQYNAVVDKSQSPTMQKFNTDVNSIINAPKPAPQGFVGSVVSPSGDGSMGSDILDSWAKVGNDYAKLSNSGFGAGGANELQTGIDAVQAFFSPVSTVFSHAATIPGPIGDVANVVNKIFGIAGTVGGDTLAAGAQHLPYVTQETRDALTPVFNQVGALAAQIVVGGITHAGYKELSGHVTTIMNTLAEDSRVKALNANPDIQASIKNQITPPEPVKLNVTSESPETKVPINTPATKQAAYAKSQGYEPYTPPEKLPTIEMGAKPKETLPTIQTEPPVSNKLGSMTVEPIKPPTPTSVEPQTPFTPTAKPVSQTPVATTETPTATPTAPEVPVPPREPGVAKAASDINQNLVKQGFDALPKDQQATFDSKSYKASANKVATMMDDNVEEVKSMAKGDTPIPDNVHPQILFNAIEALAMKTNDGALLRDLAKSPLASGSSEAGSTLGSHGYNDNPNSAIPKIREIQKAKTESVGGEKTVQANRTATVKKASGMLLPKEDTYWKNFLDKITC